MLVRSVEHKGFLALTHPNLLSPQLLTLLTAPFHCLSLMFSDQFLGYDCYSCKKLKAGKQ